jgi:small-conductance mechanosensitive channel
MHAYDLPMRNFFQQIVLGNTLQDWLLAAVAFVLTFTVLPLLRGVVQRQARRYEARELPVAAGLLLYLIRRTSRLFLLTVALYAAERILTLPGQSDRYADVAIVCSFWLQVGLWMMAAVRFGLECRLAEDHDRRLAGTINIVIFVTSLVIWIVVALLALENLDVNITALVAGLGVGGIAIALAVQAILGDLFASLSIALDKPFGVGDLLRVDDCEGTVEQIGIKSTRLRSVSGEQIILANADLLKSRVRNFQRMQERRALFTLRVRHDSSAAQLAEIPRLVAACVAAWGGARFVHCLLKSIGASALEFEVVFFVPVTRTNELNVALDAVNRAVLEKFAAAGIALAFPTRTVHLVQA